MSSKWTTIIFFIIIIDIFSSKIKYGYCEKNNLINKKNSICGALTEEMNVLAKASNDSFFGLEDEEEEQQQQKIKRKNNEQEQGESDWDNNNQKFVLKLHEWCLEDIGCRRLFFQESKKNLTIFKILLGDHFTKDQTFPMFAMSNILCNEEIKDSNELIKLLWILKLKNVVSNKNLALHCDVNHELIFSSHTLTYDCVCLPDRVCSDRLYPLTFYWIFLILFAILSLIIFFGLSYRNVVVIRGFSKIRNHLKKKKKNKEKGKKELETAITILTESIL